MEESPWIVVVTHGNFGEGLINAAEMICGKIKNLKSIKLLPGISPEDIYKEVKETIDETGKDTLILVDMFGGTPCNVCSKFAKDGYKVISGINLPILMESDMERGTDDWDNILDILKSIGQQSIVNVTENIMNKK